MNTSRRQFIKQVGITAGVLVGAMMVPQWVLSKEKHEEEEVSAVEDLMREHGLLERLLLVYEASTRRLTANDDVPLELIHKAAKINRDFIENYHEKLEEDYLFPRLLNANKQVTLVNTLLDQHQAGRRLTDNILDLSNSSNSFQRETLIQNISQYITMYRPHASREDTVLFPAFKEIVSEKEYNELGEQFEEKEHQLFGEGGFQSVLEEVAELEKQLGIDDLSKFTPSV